MSASLLKGTISATFFQEYTMRTMESHHVDSVGAFEGHMWLIIINAYTKWLDVVRIKSTSAAITCSKLREVFARYGLPRTIESDNTTQLIADEFKLFSKNNAIHQVLSMPYHLKTSGLAERAVRTFKDRMSAAKESTTAASAARRFDTVELSARRLPMIYVEK
jgi:hypothetical protein